jgi:hypothetical protein
LNDARSRRQSRGVLLKIRKLAGDEIPRCSKPEQHPNGVRYLAVGHRCHLAGNVDQFDLDQLAFRIGKINCQQRYHGNERD